MRRTSKAQIDQESQRKPLLSFWMGVSVCISHSSGGQPTKGECRPRPNLVVFGSEVEVQLALFGDYVKPMFT